MFFQNRQYQQDLETGIYRAWEHGARNVLAVLPTGGGKTATFSRILHDYRGPSVAIAHRQELVSQISIALSRYEVMHRIIAPSKVIKWIIQLQVEETGRSFYDPGAPCAVAGVDTLLRRADKLGDWPKQVGFWVNDEAHHVLKTNKWGRAIEMFPNARGLGVTATPLRADGKGLGRHHDGLMDEMIVGPSMRDLINASYLADYRVISAPSDLQLDGVTITAQGDYNTKQLRQRVKKSHIVGDVVEHYLRFASGKQGVTFVTDIETAMETAEKFRAAGVKAEIITSKTPDKQRVEILRRFGRKELQQLVNVDILGEGFDVPAIEVVSFARPTESYGLYVQQFGRALRILAGKGKAIIIDHVGNIMRHGLPDAPKQWTLDRRERGAKGKRDPDVIPLRQCLNELCFAVYEAVHNDCPYCGHEYLPPGRSAPEFVDGDLTELDPQVLAEMRGEKKKVDMPTNILMEYVQKSQSSHAILGGIRKNHETRQRGQRLLRNSIAWWAGHQEQKGYDTKQIYKLFYWRFGTDILTAQSLGAKDAEQLAVNINKSIDDLVNKR